MGHLTWDVTTKVNNFCNISRLQIRSTEGSQLSEERNSTCVFIKKANDPNVEQAYLDDLRFLDATLRSGSPSSMIFSCT